jgi:hypothetical protein
MLILPLKARREVSIIAVQVKVGVECVVKSSEFRFHELRVNETRLSEGRKLVIYNISSIAITELIHKGMEFDTGLCWKYN